MALVLLSVQKSEVTKKKTINYRLNSYKACNKFIVAINATTEVYCCKIIRTQKNIKHLIQLLKLHILVSGR